MSAVPIEERAGSRSPDMLAAPVGALRGHGPILLRQRDLHELEVGALAGLVRTRLQLDHSQGWLLFGIFIVGLATLALAATVVESKAVVGAFAVTLAWALAGSKLVVDRACEWLFARRARAEGLSEAATRRAFVAAGCADHWLDVLHTLEQHPSDAEVAHFVLGAARQDAPR